MKGPDYVSRVVRAYRILLDAPDADWRYALADAENLLAEAPGRRTTGGPLAASIEGALAPLSATTSGLKLGFMTPEGPERGRVTLERPVKVDDRLRLQSKAGEESAGFNLRTIIMDGQNVDLAPAGSEVLLGGPNFPNQKGMLFKVSSGSEEKSFLASPLVKTVKEWAKTSRLPAPKALPPELRSVASQKAPGTPLSRLGFWVWLDKAEDLRELAGFEARKIILPLTVPNVRHIHNNRRRIKNEIERLVWSLPPLIFHRQQNLLNQELAGLIAGGSREFLVSNLAQINMVQRAGREVSGLKLWGDHRLGFLNHMTEAALISLGLTGVTFSPEGDGENFQKLWRIPAAGQRLIYLYGRPALFTARFPLDARQIPLTSPKGEKFRITREGEEIAVLAERPVFMGPLLKMPPLPGGAGLILDLRSEPHLGAKLREMKKALAGGGTNLGSSFNFKRTLM